MSWISRHPEEVFLDPLVLTADQTKQGALGTKMWITALFNNASSRVRVQNSTNSFAFHRYRNYHSGRLRKLRRFALKSAKVMLVGCYWGISIPFVSFVFRRPMFLAIDKE